MFLVKHIRLSVNCVKHYININIIKRILHRRKSLLVFFFSFPKIYFTLISFSKKKFFSFSILYIEKYFPFMVVIIYIHFRFQKANPGFRNKLKIVTIRKEKLKKINRIIHKNQFLASLLLSSIFENKQTNTIIGEIQILLQFRPSCIWKKKIRTLIPNINI